MHCAQAAATIGRRAPNTGSRSKPEAARRTFVDDVRELALEEELDAGGGYRSLLGLMKHRARWSELAP